MPSERSWPGVLPSSLSVAITSSTSSRIWKTIPNASPKAVRSSIWERSKPAVMPPILQAVDMSAAVLLDIAVR